MEIQKHTGEKLEDYFSRLVAEGFEFDASYRKRTIITRPEQNYGRVPLAGLCRNFVHFRICSRCRTAGCQGISFSSSSWVGDLPR